MKRFAEVSRTKDEGQTGPPLTASVPRPASFSLAGQRPAPPAEEALIVDARCRVRPAQQVEEKLFASRLRALCRERGAS